MNIKKLFADRMSRKLWDAMRSHIALAATPGVGGIAFLGDSITHMGKWDLLFPRAPISNLGIAGERSGHLLDRLDSLIAMNPEKLFILIGTNDLWIDIPVDEIAANMETMLGRLRRDIPACRLYVQSVMPRQRKFAARVKAVNERYRALAAKHGATYVDLFPLLDDGTGQLRAELTPDVLHLNGAGYLIWRDAIRDLVLG